MTRQPKPHFRRFLPLALLLLLVGCGGEKEQTTSPQPPRATGGQDQEVTPEAIEAALQAADEYFNSEENAKAEAILARLIDKAPREGRARELMGQVLIFKAMEAEERGDREDAAAARAEAYEHYRVAVELTPNSAGLQQSAGTMAMMAGQTDAALNHFRTAARLDPSNPQHPLYAAQILIQQGNYTAARDALDQVLLIDPDEPVAHASLAMIAFHEKQYDKALAHIETARDIAPTDLRFRVQEAKIHRGMGDSRRSLELLIGLAEEERTEEAVTEEIAFAYGELGEHAKAAEAWSARFNARPNDPRAYVAAVRVAEALLELGRRDEAMQWSLQARVRAPESEEVRALDEKLRDG